MKHPLTHILALAVLTICYEPHVKAADVVAVCFTPGGACTDVIVNQITNSNRQVLVQAYSFTSPDIVNALAAAKRRGVDVRVILDKSNACKGSEECEKKGALAAETLSSIGVPILIDQIHGIAHNKVIIIDGERIITGSFNFTKAAQDRNAENLMVISDQNLSQQYSENWQERASHSEVW